MIKRNWKLLFVVLSQLFDVVAIWLAGSVIFYLKWTDTIQYVTPDDNLVIGLVIFSVIHLVVASMLGLYRGSFHLSLRLQNLIATRAFVVSMLFALALNSFSQTFVGKKSVVTFALMLPMLLLISRIILLQLNFYFQRRGFGLHNSLIIGLTKESERLFTRFEKYPELGYKIRGFIVHERVQKETVLPQFTFAEVDKAIDDHSIDRIFYPTVDFSANGYSPLQQLSEQKRVKFKIVSPLAEEILKIARIYDIAGITLTAQKRTHLDPAKAFVKRIFDVVVASLVILFLSPIFVITIVAIYLETGRPIFFMQRRGAVKGGNVFNFIKFRSMVTDAEQMKHELIGKNESDGALFKMKNDPRVTRVGKIIRKVSIDELPQLINVLKGDMSLVGPRPLPLSDFEKADEPEEFWNAIKDRGTVKPGMTGLWQISGRSEIKFKEMILLDLYYVENHSILFDVEILFETVPVVLFGRGAY
ncbi:MAG: sugar transferase [Bacteroidota bacterium]|jgi:exopolysaccharide biosynthesis polyprenyl glycosylphosphotransferase